MNCFRTLKTVLDTPFLLALPRAAPFSADYLFVCLSGFRSFYKVFYKSAEISVVFFFVLVFYGIR